MQAAAAAFVVGATVLGSASAVDAASSTAGASVSFETTLARLPMEPAHLVADGAESGFRGPVGDIDGAEVDTADAPVLGLHLPAVGDIEGGKPRRVGAQLEQWEAEVIAAALHAQEAADRDGRPAMPVSNSRMLEGSR